MEIHVRATAGSPDTRRLRAPLAVWPLLLIAVGWFLLEIIVGLDFARDRHVAYAGTVLEVGDSWTDPLTLDFTPVKHLVIRTPDGRVIDRTVPVAELAHARVAVGDSVVKKRGFGERVRVPGKASVSEMLDAARARLRGHGSAVD